MNTSTKEAVVIGATGLVGRELVSLLLDDSRFSQVRTLVRRPSGRGHPKLQEQIVDFERLDAHAADIRGDVLFSTMGTTIRAAGSQAGQRRVDYDYQYNAAAIAARNGIKSYVLISAAGANAGSPFFYMRMKGELEKAVQKLPFQSIHILQPGFLDGERSEDRPGEKIGLALTRWLTQAGPLQRYRPIHGRTVARAMVAASLDSGSPLKIHGPVALFTVAEQSGL